MPPDASAPHHPVYLLCGVPIALRSVNNPTPKPFVKYVFRASLLGPSYYEITSCYFRGQLNARKVEVGRTGNWVQLEDGALVSREDINSPAPIKFRNPSHLLCLLPQPSNSPSNDLIANDSRERMLPLPSDSVRGAREMTQSELVGPGHFGLAAPTRGDPPPALTGIRAESSAEKTPTAGVVSKRVDPRLTLFCNSSCQPFRLICCQVLLALRPAREKVTGWDCQLLYLQLRPGVVQHPASPREVLRPALVSVGRDIMGFGKSSPFLAFSILVLCQASSLQAAPFRSSLESLPDLASLNEKEGRLLLAALVKAYVQRKASELEEEQETEGSSLDGSKAKRCSSLSTCVLSAYAKDLNNFHTFSSIGFGPETPGKKRAIARSLELDHFPHLGLPQDAN
ncbi:Calcitonin [Galemys pyrenaicus]|uniref:Calcitonin n=1 Tax=Galemys pyrenaicus TaxID=202257 RepID=A0A8J6DXI0_GALPY|nr:Calcitonin [Galemys pyrenaicus]